MTVFSETRTRKISVIKSGKNKTLMGVVEYILDFNLSLKVNQLTTPFTYPRLNYSTGDKKKEGKGLQNSELLVRVKKY